MTDPLRILGIDPGGHRSGWALVETVPDKRGYVRFLSGGWADNAEVTLLVASGQADMVAVECPRGYIHQHARGAALLETARAAGAFAQAARDAGLRVLEMSASEWRRAVCGKGNATDRRVKNTVPMFTADMPPRSNAHLRDALGVAIAAAWGPMSARLGAA